MFREFPAPHSRASAPGRLPRAYFWHKRSRVVRPGEERREEEPRNSLARQRKRPAEIEAATPHHADRGAADPRGSRLRGRGSLKRSARGFSFRERACHPPSRAGVPSRAGARGTERPPFTPARSTSESPTSPTHRNAGGSA